MPLANVIAQLREQTNLATRSTRFRRGLSLTSFSSSSLVEKDLHPEKRGRRGFPQPYACAGARARAYARPGGRTGTETSSTSSTSFSDTPSSQVTILPFCRCGDCRKFSEAAGESYCAEGIGGTKVVWATGERFCNPAPDQWHYCAGYDGPQISKDVWVWPRLAPQAAQVGAGSNISDQAEQPDEDEELI